MDQEVHISQDDITAFLKRGFLYAIAATLIVGSATYILRRDTPPTFEATATVYAADSGLDMRSLGLSYVVAPTLQVTAYSVAALSTPVLTDTLATLGVSPASDQDLESATQDLTISADTESSLITIKARAGTPEGAAALANAEVNALMKWDGQRPKANLQRITAGLNDRIASLNQQIAANPDQHDILTSLRSEQLAQLATVSMLADSVISRLEIVKPAASPLVPIAPSPVFETALAGLLAFCGAYLVLFLSATLDSRLRGPRQISLASGYPVLASYGTLPKPPHRIPALPTSFLRTALTPTDSVTTTILLTGLSSGPAVGRLAVGLAESFARSGFTTLLIGTAENSKSLVSRYGLPSKGRSSLESYLRSPAEVPPAFEIRLDRETTLDVLPSYVAGDDFPELLSRGFDTALQRWSTDHHVIIIETPPLLTSADALTIAPYCSSVTLVVDRRTTSRKRLVTAIGLLQQRQAAVAGLVVTHVPASERGPQVFAATASPTSPSRSTADKRLATTTQGFDL